MAYIILLLKIYNAHKKRRIIKDETPPFAGIILIRFSGYFLSDPANWRKAPRELCFY
jgi:hypothetical protein